MDIASISMTMAQTDLQSQVGIAMLDKTLNLADTLGSELVSMLEASAMEHSVTPYIGGNIDISV